VAKARVFKIQDTWHYQLTSNQGVVVVTDNTGYWEPIFAQAFESAKALCLVEFWGHKLSKPYRDIVDEVGYGCH
jgi:hypothetical protein